MGALAREGRDKMTLIVDAPIDGFGAWAEQLVAESTGKLGVGVEAFYDHDTVKGARGHAAEMFAIGPSIQWRVTRNIHVDLNCMFGTNRDTDRQIGYLIIGYDFGPGESKKKGYTPISGQRN